MCRYRSLPGTVLVVFWLVGFYASAQTPAPDPSVLEACPSIVDLAGADTGFQDLVNPVLRTPADVDRRAGEYREMVACLNSVPVGAAYLDWARNLRYHLGLFLSFAAPAEANARGSTLELVDLELSQDPAVRRLVGDVGLAPPEGLILVRHFQSLEQMPGNIRRAFEDSETRAVTMSSRYVAVLDAVSAPALAATFSHELVHAFLNARLDAETLPEGFPRWFHEGMAIHFSDSGRMHIGVDPVSGTLLSTEPTARYEQYERVFNYLESELGTGDFHREVRRAVEDVDPSVLYTGLGFASYDELVRNAERWWRWWPVPPAWLRGRNAWMLSLVVLILGLGVWVLWRRWEPAVAGSALEVGVDSDLLESVKAGDTESVRYLIRSGANPEVTDDAGWSALAWAVWTDNTDAVEMLIEAGAEVTPIIERLAVSRGSSPETERVLADAVTREDEDSIEID